MWTQKTNGSHIADFPCVASSRRHDRSRGVTVSTLDPESSDRGSNPREVSFIQTVFFVAPTHRCGACWRRAARFGGKNERGLMWDLTRRALAAKMVPRGLEPRTLRLLAVRSSQLSYETVRHGHDPPPQLRCSTGHSWRAWKTEKVESCSLSLPEDNPMYSEGLSHLCRECPD